MDNGHILTLNCGSSSIKLGLFHSTPALPLAYRATLERLDDTPLLTVSDGTGRTLLRTHPGNPARKQPLAYLLQRLEGVLPDLRINAAGHRIVHGGAEFAQPLLLNPQLLERLQQLIPLAPLHMPHNLAAVRALAARHPGLPQVACFDTAFHRTMPWEEQAYALPRHWFDRGLRRYGFHGLSYEYIAHVLPDHLGPQADGRVIVAHLGHGASLCAMRRRRSLATSMGFSPLDGIPMATRPGALDPAIPGWLLDEGGLSSEALEQLLNHRSGLLGLSGSSGDVRRLLESDDPRARQAIDYFIHHTQRAIASLAAVLGGIDALVFTAGIGEHSATIRERICQQAGWLGIRIDPRANRANALRISTPDSRVAVWRLATDEAYMIARHTRRLTAPAPKSEPPRTAS